jgi:endonuclease YncB( thermonuclease family)
LGAALRAHIAGRAIDRESEGKDRYGRTLATCFLDSEDLNGWMVEEGQAVAYRKYSTAYVVQEQEAQAAHRGLWAGSFVMPWDWRKQH